ncbi:MAG: ribonuclease H family protein [Bdellovibrionota bacterium]|jgi:ribonuclease HI
MANFNCIKCNSSFSIPSEVLAKYPNWTPKYCKNCNPKKKNNENTQNVAKSNAYDTKGDFFKEEDLTLEEVLKKFKNGPKTGIFTDGSARPNPGSGGWGVVFVKDGKIIEQKYGNEKETTNNRMELTALLNAFKMAPKNEEILVYTDSELCVNTFNKWIFSWEKNGWKKKTGEIKNLDLVKKVYEAIKEKPNAKLTWIESHSGFLWNEYADSLATAWARKTL